MLPLQFEFKNLWGMVLAEEKMSDVPLNCLSFYQMKFGLVDKKGQFVENYLL